MIAQALASGTVRIAKPERVASLSAQPGLSHFRAKSLQLPVGRNVGRRRPFLYASEIIGRISIVGG
jgi:hypothetical protein